MSTEGKSYQDLSADAQATALKSFIAFYVDQYKRESLEILGSEVDNGLISSINEILDQNSFMGRGELVAESLRLSKPYYEEILAKLPAILLMMVSRSRTGKQLGKVRKKNCRRKTDSKAEDGMGDGTISLHPKASDLAILATVRIGNISRASGFGLCRALEPVCVLRCSRLSS